MAEEGEVRKEKRKQSKSLAQEGEVRRKNGQYTDAIRRFTEALEIDGEYAWAYAHRGAARAALDDWEPCCADFQKAVELKPDYGWAYARWGEAHRIHASHRLGRADTPPDWREQHAIIDRGIELLERAAELSPGSAWTFAHRGATYTYKYWLEVMPRLVPALELDNGPTPAPEARSSKGNDAAARALQDLDKARELNPRYAWVCAFKTCVLALIAREQPDMTPGLLAARDWHPVGRPLSRHRGAQTAGMLLGLDLLDKPGSGGTAIETLSRERLSVEAIGLVAFEPGPRPRRGSRPPAEWRKTRGPDLASPAAVARRSEREQGCLARRGGERRWSSAAGR
ncbi:tetratricopeptide repeat protein [Sorangium sp. So ce176]|uniref:tetratricopeptide repeat protein n=1 Tax=Sorangium sp. So ce176 TaxID=3133286 RepID=UPI003F6258F1